MSEEKVELVPEALRSPAWTWTLLIESQNGPFQWRASDVLLQVLFPER
jgi:hypothetical protein